MEKEIQLLKKQVSLLKLGVIFSSIFILVLIILFFNYKNGKDVIITKGIIIQDSLGRDRILIGSPAPYSADRIRTDYTKVEKVWAAKII